MAQESDILSRVDELRAHHGKGWKEIARIVEEEGYEEKGKALTDNALRKRYNRWKESEASCGPSSESAVSDFDKKPRKFDLDWLEKSRMEASLKPFEEAEAADAGSPEKIVSEIASLVSLNNQLLEQVRQSNERMQRLERRLEEQERETSHTGIEIGEQPVTTRDLLELLKEFMTRREQEMQFVEEKKEYYPSRQEIQELIEKSVEDRVEAELKSMLSEQGSFSRQLALLVDDRLKTLFSGGEPVTQAPHAGPGRGRKGKTHKKFSASLEESLFERVKSLPGQFSGHLANALEAYLAVVEEKEPA